MAENPNHPFIALIMAGGSGTRFWPMSRPEKPKQYLNLIEDKSLIQSTANRLKKLTANKNIFICSAENQKSLLNEQLPELENLILEPCGKNTAPCLMLSVAHLLAQGYPKDSVMGVFPADHFIGNEEAFLKTVQLGIQEAASTNNLVTLGIQPTSPHTGYGYIEATQAVNNSQCYPVKRFVEKPPVEKAKEYLEQGNFFWNAGIFIWKLETIAKAFDTFLKEEWESVQLAVKNKSIHQMYSRLTKQPIDIAILEKASNVTVIPAQMEWSDIGSWNALLEHMQKLQNSSNVVLPATGKNVQLLNTHNCLVASESNKPIVLIGVDDIIVVESEHGILVTHRTQDQRVKEIS